MTAPVIQYVRESQRNQPNGFAGLDADGDLVIKAVILRHMTFAELMDGTVPEAGEPVYCTDTREIFIGDGGTIGGQFHSGATRLAEPVTTSATITDGASVDLYALDILPGAMYEMWFSAAVTDNQQKNHRIDLPSDSVAARWALGGLDGSGVPSASYNDSDFRVPANQKGTSLLVPDDAR